MWIFGISADIPHGRRGITRANSKRPPLCPLVYREPPPMHPRSAPLAPRHTHATYRVGYSFHGRAAVQRSRSARRAYRVTIVYSIYMITQNTSMEDISSSFVDFCTVARSASSEAFSFIGKVGEELLIHFGFATRTLPVIEEKVEDDTNPVVNMVLLSCASFAVTLLSNMG